MRSAVRSRLSPPKQYNPNPLPIGHGFGFVVFMEEVEDWYSRYGFLFRRICSSRPGDGNSADRAWQLSQLLEGVSTAFNPSHGSLSYVQAGHCVSKQIGRHDAACQGCPRCVSRSPEARCLRVFARAVRVSQPAVLSALLVFTFQGPHEGNPLMW